MDLDDEELKETKKYKIIKLKPEDLKFTDQLLSLEEYREMIREMYKNYKGEIKCFQKILLTYTTKVIQ